MANKKEMIGSNGLLYITNKISALLTTKVDTETGKGLSTNDYTTNEKTKLAGIDEGANKTTINNTLTSDSTTEALSAAQGKTLNTSISNKLDKTGDASSTTAAFTAATTRTNISTGEKLSVIFGKVAKWFSDLKAVAFSGSYSDLSDTPTIPDGSSTTPAMDGTAAVGTDTAWARGDHVHPSDTSRVPTTRTINGKALSEDITLSASDVGAASSSIKYAGSATAGGAATSVANALSISLNGTTAASYNGSAAKSVNITPAAIGAQASGDYPTKAEMTSAIAAAGHITKEIVTELPDAADASETVIYMIAKTTASGDNAYDEYMLVNGTMEKIGDTEADLSNYLQDSDVEELTNEEIDAIWSQVFTS